VPVILSTDHAFSISLYWSEMSCWATGSTMVKGTVL
jgi:hypothetical protein